MELITRHLIEPDVCEIVFWNGSCESAAIIAAWLKSKTQVADAKVVTDRVEMEIHVTAAILDRAKFHYIPAPEITRQILPKEWIVWRNPGTGKGPIPMLTHDELPDEYQDITDRFPRDIRFAESLRREFEAFNDPAVNGVEQITAQRNKHLGVAQEG